MPAKMFSRASVAVAVLAAPAIAQQPNSSVNQPAPPLVEPVVLIEAGNIRACGVRVIFDARPSGKYELIVRRNGSDAILAIRANADFDLEAEHRLNCRPTLETQSFSTRTLMQGETVRIDGMKELSTPATDDTIARLIQELMIGGGRFTCEKNAARSPVFQVKGPLPQQTRAAYLNCSGDLFRPEEER